MQVVRSLDSLPLLTPPIALTIGTFDGVHLGHQFLFNELKKRAPQTAVLTFSNHPLEIIRPSLPLTFLTTTEEKIRLIEAEGIDWLILLNFSQELADLNYRDFILAIRAHLPFTLLLLGEGATMGKGRAGTQEKLSVLALELGFEILYLKKALYKGAPISSQRIRSALAAQDRLLAEKLLGRPFPPVTK